MSPRDLDIHVDAFLTHVKRQQLRPEYQLVVDNGGHRVTACVCIDAPGRSAMVFPPSVQANKALTSCAGDMLRKLVSRLRRDGVRLLQCLLWPKVAEDETLLAEVGFEYLTELIYLDRRILMRQRASATGLPLTWCTYDAQSHDLFLETIRATYGQSLDCPRLNGLRDMSDVLAGHKATGQFDASDWSLALLRGEPAGVLLLSRVSQRRAMEVVYMGVVPEARGQGVATALLQRALARSRERRVARLILAVDANNLPAMTLYDRFGFFETARRRAWIYPL
jgi:ribosomal protein S18 acetylase RimI-like enzyme